LFQSGFSVENAEKPLRESHDSHLTASDNWLTHIKLALRCPKLAMANSPASLFAVPIRQTGTFTFHGRAIFSEVVGDPGAGEHNDRCRRSTHLKPDDINPSA
jgi:hypothetical protein